CAGWHTAALAVNLSDLNAIPPEYPIHERPRPRRLMHQAVEIEGDFVPFDFQ
ncbi:hypothetical protein K502DRAFT_350571, partial [Neoconidiobolus thromboides FSU 785]